jgi:hypothetical protein
MTTSDARPPVRGRLPHGSSPWAEAHRHGRSPGNRVNRRIGASSGRFGPVFGEKRAVFEQIESPVTRFHGKRTLVQLGGMGAARADPWHAGGQLLMTAPDLGLTAAVPFAATAIAYADDPPSMEDLADSGRRAESRQGRDRQLPRAAEDAVRRQRSRHGRGGSVSTSC